MHELGEHRVELLNITCFTHHVLIRKSNYFKKNRWNIGQIDVHIICVHKIKRRILCGAALKSTEVIGRCMGGYRQYPGLLSVLGFSCRASIMCYVTLVSC